MKNMKKKEKKKSKPRFKRDIRVLKVSFDCDSGEMLGFDNLKSVLKGLNTLMIMDLFQDLERAAESIYEETSLAWLEAQP